MVTRELNDSLSFALSLMYSSYDRHLLAFADDSTDPLLCTESLSTH